MEQMFHHLLILMEMYQFIYDMADPIYHNL